jgi:hypothetical protein
VRRAAIRGPVVVGGAADRVAHELDGDGEVRQRVAVVSDPDDVGARAVE